MKIKSIICLISVFAFAGVFVSASAAEEYSRAELNRLQKNPDYLNINPDSIKITFLESGKEESSKKISTQTLENINGAIDTANHAADTVNNGVNTAGNIINLAKKVWKIIDDSRPVANVKTVYATALPEGVGSAKQLTNWSRPVSYTYGFYAENYLGMKMVDVTYKVTYNYGGRYKGTGKYLTNVSIVPEKVSVGWGYSFDMSASVPDSALVNVGSAEDPVAAMQLSINWKISTLLKTNDCTSVYYIEGSGKMQEVASPFSSDGKVKYLVPERLINNSEIPSSGANIKVPLVNGVSL